MDIDNTNENLKNITSTLREILSTLPSMAKQMNSMAGVSKNVAKSYTELNAANKELLKITDRTSVAYALAEKKSKEKLQAYKAEAEAAQKTAKDTGLLSDAYDKLANSQDKSISKSDKFEKGLRSTVRTLEGVRNTASMFNNTIGIQSVNFDNVYKMAIRYNRANIDLSRTQRLFGSTSGDTQKAFAIFKNGSAMSAVAGMEFANSINKMTVGLKPSMEETAKFSEVLSRAFGVGNTEKIKEVTNSIQKLQNKFPPLKDQLLAVSEAYRTGSKDADKLAREFMATAELSGEFSSEDLENYMATMKGLNREETKANELEKASAMARAANEDTLAKAAETTQEQLKMTVNALEKVQEMMAENIKTVIAFQTVLAGLNVALNLGGLFGGFDKLAKTFSKSGTVANTAGKVTSWAKGLFKGGSQVASAASQGGQAANVAKTASQASQAVPKITLQAFRSGTVGAAEVAGKAAKPALEVAETASKFAKIGKAAGPLALALETINVGRLIFSKEHRAKEDKKFTEKGKYGMLGQAAEGFFSPTSAMYSFGKQGIGAIKDKYNAHSTGKDVADMNVDIEKAQRSRFGDEKFEQKAKESGLDKETDAIKKKKILKSIGSDLLKQEDDIKKKKEANITPLEKQVKLYESIKVINTRLLDISNKIVTSISQQLSAAKEMGAIIPGLSESLATAAANAAASAKTKVVENLKGISDKYHIELDVKTLGIAGAVTKATNEMNKQMADKQSQMDKIKSDPNKDETQKLEAQKTLLAEKFGLETKISALNEEAATALTAQSKSLKDQVLASRYKADVSAETNAITLQEAQMNEEVAAKSHQGAIIGLQFKNQQLQIGKDTIKEEQGAYEKIKRTADEGKVITGNQVEQVSLLTTRGQKEAELLRMATAQGKMGLALDDFMREGLVASEALVQSRIKQRAIESKNLDITKGLREGYLNAFEASRTMAGEFDGLIGTSTEAVSQMMNIVGGKNMNSMTMGGRGGGEDSGRGELQASQTYGQGMTVGTTTPQEQARVKEFEEIPNEGKGTGVGSSFLPSHTADALEASRVKDSQALHDEKVVGLNQAALDKAGSQSQARAAQPGAPSIDKLAEKVKSASNLGDQTLGAPGAPPGTMEGKAEKTMENMHAPKEPAGGGVEVESAKVVSKKEILGYIMVSIDKNGEISTVLKEIQDSSVKLASAQGGLAEGLG